MFSTTPGGRLPHKSDGWQKQVRDALETWWREDVYSMGTGADVRAADLGS